MNEEITRSALHSLAHQFSHEKLEPLLATSQNFERSTRPSIISILSCENRRDILQAVAELRRTLTNATDLTAHIESNSVTSTP